MGGVALLAAAAALAAIQHDVGLLPWPSGEDGTAFLAALIGARWLVRASVEDESTSTPGLWTSCGRGLSTQVRGLCAAAVCGSSAT